MAENLIIIRTVPELKQLVDAIEGAEFVAYDTETVSTEYNTQIIGFSVAVGTNTGYYVILSYWDKEAKKLIATGLKEPCKPIIEALTRKHVIMQNAVFDCEKTFYNLGIDLMPAVHSDTMLMAHLLDENRPCGLKELAVAIFGEDSAKEQAEMKASVTENGGMLTKTCYELYKGDSDLIAKYGAKDAILTLKVFYHLVLQLFEQGLDKFYYDDETMPLLRGPTYDMNTTGLRVDMEKLQALKAELQIDIGEAKAFIRAETEKAVQEKYPGTSKAKTFNIGANQQLAWLLYGKLNNEFHKVTEGGRELCRALGIKIPYALADKRNFIRTCTQSIGKAYTVPGCAKPKKVREPWAYLECGKEALAKLAPRYKWVAKLLELKKNEKLLSTYVEGIQDRVQYGVIRPSFLQHGTTSGRYSSRYPNFQNLPRKDKRIKDCIVPRPGNVFIGADYSQLEPRVFASFSGDERLQAAFKSGDDFYSVAGIETYEKYECTPQKDGSPNAFGVKYPDLRDIIKVIVLAATYGANEYQLAPVVKKRAEETREIIDLYFDKFPKVKQFQLACHQEAKDTGQVVSLFGRPRRIPKAKLIPQMFGKTAHEDLDYEWRNLLNLAVNHPVQSTGASIVNRAAIATWRQFRKMEAMDPQWKNVKIVLQVHDSLVVEAPEPLAQQVVVILQDCMQSTVKLPGVALEAKPIIGKSLADV